MRLKRFRIGDIMEYYLLWKVLLVTILTDIMDMCSFYRRRNHSYFSVHQNDTRDGWHDSKKILLFFVFGELVKWDIVLLIIAGILHFIIHEYILFHGWFKSFINN
jgi:hypothetical protein